MTPTSLATLSTPHVPTNGKQTVSREQAINDAADAYLAALESSEARPPK